MEFVESYFRVLSRIFDPLFIPVRSWERLYWVYLIGAAILAIPVYFKLRKSSHSIKDFFSFLAPKEVFLHPSAKVDYIFLFMNRFVMLVIILPFIMGSDYVSIRIEHALNYFGEPFFSITPSFTLSLIYTFALLIAFDFALFIAHYWFHRIPLLWEFHKVHHSAETLTPVTIYRFHPVDDGLSMLVVVLMSGTVSGVFHYFVEGDY